jgi:hypothetical protein
MDSLNLRDALKRAYAVYPLPDSGGCQEFASPGDFLGKIDLEGDSVIDVRR